MAKSLARGGRRDEVPSRSILTRAVDSVFDFVRLAEFEILFVFFFVVAYVIFKDLENACSFFRWKNREDVDIRSKYVIPRLANKIMELKKALPCYKSPVESNK
ncbi:hypothetical protein RDI58_007247 [Solanum bulbocastanum]|uniref:Uncharacterized protein n=1 Tax=Solanum bulbocastanum TaxID=147425 RepID=A0AAN8YHI9_SOLBU